jgi:hypothetical protein
MSHEASFCGYTSVAISALSHLLDLSSEKKGVREKEAILLRNLIKLVNDKSPDDTSETVQYYARAKDRLQTLGKEGFFGGGMVGEKEVRWFAGSAWNSGLQAAKSEDWLNCARFLESASAFYEHLPEALEDLQALSLCHMMGAAAALQAVEQPNVEELKSVEEKLEKYKAVSNGSDGSVLLRLSHDVNSSTFPSELVTLDLDQGRFTQQV